MIARTGDFDPAELRQVRRQKLGIEQAIATEPQADGQMHEGHFARVGHAAEHAFAEEGSADRDAVESADQHALSPCFDAMHCAAREESRIQPRDLVIDPGVGALFGRLGAAADHVLESAVAADLEILLPHDTTQAPRHVERLERQDPAAARINPEQLWVVRRFGHWEDPGCICGEQDVGGEPQRVSAPITPDA